MADILENPPVLQQPFAYNGDKNTIPLNATGDQRASLQEGFPPITSVKITEGGIPPERKDFNGLGNLLSSLYFYLQNGGQFTFNQQVSDAIGGYPAGAILTYTDSVTHISYNVVSLINNNTFNFVAEPSYIDGVKWTRAYSEDLSPYQLKSNLSQVLDSSTEKYPSNKAVQDGLAKRKLIAYDTDRNPGSLSGSYTLVLQDNDERVSLKVNDNITITIDTSQLTFPKEWYTVVFEIYFSNGAKTVNLSCAGGIRWINGLTPDFTNGLAHLLALTKHRSWGDVVMSDAGTLGG